MADAITDLLRRRSADGYIAGPEGQFDFFSFDGDLAAWIIEEYPETLPVQAREALGIADRDNEHFDTVVMGRRTYQPALDAGILSPYPHLRQIVFSTTLAAGTPDVEVVNGSPGQFIRELKKTDGRGIWLAGGGRLAAELSTEIDELVIKRNPSCSAPEYPSTTALLRRSNSSARVPKPLTPAWSWRSTAKATDQILRTATHGAHPVPVSDR